MVNNVINVFSLIVTGCLLVCANIVILMIFQFPDIGIPDGFGRSQTKRKRPLAVAPVVTYEERSESEAGAER